jgi:hypothetical protein
MQNVAVDATTASSEDRNELHDAIVSDLVSLIECVRTSMELINAAVVSEERLDCAENDINVVVLDDVTPSYVKARAALDNCEAHLGAALHFLRDAGTPQPGTAEIGRARRLAYPLARA